MRKFLIGLTTLFALVVAMPVNAQTISFLNGNEIMKICKDSDSGERRQNESNYNACVTYLMGVTDAHHTLVDRGSMPNSYFCLSIGVSGEQLRQVFLKYMDAMDWHFVPRAGDCP